MTDREQQMEEQTDPAGEILALIGKNGWTVEESKDGDRHLFVAKRFSVALIVRADNRYAGACDLAKRCGIDLKG